MAISKKNVSTADLKLIALEKSFHQSLALLTKHVIQQENRILKTLDTLKVKLKKAVTQQKAIKKPKKKFNREIEVFTSIKVTKESNTDSKMSSAKKSESVKKTPAKKDTPKVSTATKVIIRKRPAEPTTELK